MLVSFILQFANGLSLFGVCECLNNIDDFLTAAPSQRKAITAVAIIMNNMKRIAVSGSRLAVFQSDLWAFGAKSAPFANHFCPLKHYY
jgi:hypothetical protein